MLSNIDWKGILLELRLLITQLQSDRFYALYLLAVFVIAICMLR